MNSQRFKVGEYVNHASGDKDALCHVIIATPENPRKKNPGPGEVNVESGYDYVIIQVPKNKRAEVTRPYIQVTDSSLQPFEYYSIEILASAIDQVRLAELVELAIERATLVEASHYRNNKYRLGFLPDQFKEAKTILEERKISHVVLREGKLHEEKSLYHK